MDGLKKLIPGGALLIAAIPAAAQNVAAPALLAPQPGIGQPSPGGYVIQPQVTEIGQYAQWMHNSVLMPVITAIALVVLGLLLWVVVRYRASANPVPTRTSHNAFIEVIWTVVPVLILVGIAIPSIDLLRAQYHQPKADLTVKVIGHQWYWSYQYPDNGNFEVVSNVLSDEQDRETGQPRLLGVDERMVIPVGKVIKVIVTSDDVIHSFAVPAFWTKMDAVPGRLNETWFKVERPGLYYGECSELCGAKHGFMPIAVEVLPEEQFAQWVASKGGTTGSAKAPAASETGPPPTTSDATAPAVTSQAATANQGPTT